MEENKQYGFFSVLAMIVGICIGSGIFFKTASILENTWWNVALWVLIFVLGAISIIFGSLTLAQLAFRSTKDCGLIWYVEEFLGARFAAWVWWFQAFVYLPTIVVIVAWVTGIYTLELFPLDLAEQWILPTQILIGLAYMLLLWLLNIISLRAGAIFQSSVMIIKLIPLILIALVGLARWNPDVTLTDAIVSGPTVSGRTWLMAIVPMAYAYDGWIVATSLGNQVRNPQTTMRKALIVGPLIVLAVYLLYYLGMVNLLGVEQILLDGKNAVYTAWIRIFGESGGKLILVSVLISLLGVLNGLTIALLRLPQILGQKGMLTDHFRLPSQDPDFFSPKIIILTIVSVLVWTLVHFLVMKYELFGGGDISEIAIVFSYLIYAVLYVRAWQIPLSTNRFVQYGLPFLALCGTAIIVIGSLFINRTNVLAFFWFCGLFCLLGYLFAQK